MVTPTKGTFSYAQQLYKTNFLQGKTKQTKQKTSEHVYKQKRKQRQKIMKGVKKIEG